MSEMAAAASPPHEALQDLDLNGAQIGEVLQYLSIRSINGWTKFKLREVPEFSARLITCAKTEHVLLIIVGRRCVDRYVYGGLIELARRRVLLRLPDLTIKAR